MCTVKAAPGEVLSWAHSCNRGMRRWAEANGVFVPLDDHYEATAFRDPSRPEREFAPARDRAPLDPSRRRAFRCGFRHPVI